MSSNVRRRRRTIEERLGAAVRHLRPGDLAGRGEPLPRDRGATRVSSGGQGEGGDRGSHIEHVTLLATASQTVASGGASLGFDRIEGPPTERSGFETLSARLAASGEVFAIPTDVTGLRKWFAHLIFADEITATITLTRLRNGIETTLEEYEGTGDQWFDGSSLMIRDGDTTTITVTTSTATSVTWGRIFVDDFGATGPATPERPATVYEQTYALWTSGGDWPDATAEWIWTDVDGNHPDEDAWVAQRFYLPTSATVRVWLSTDNTADLYVDGTLLLSAPDQPNEARGNVKGTVALDAGWHTVAVVGDNNLQSGAETVAGIRVAVYEHVGGADTDLLLHTDTGWYGWTSEPVGWPAPSLSGGA